MKLIHIVITENLLSLFILNDNVKITKLLRRLLAIYSRAIKRIKMKYFWQYYNNIVLLDYIKYEKLNNMFKRKRIQYKRHSKNNKLRNLDNNNNFRTVNMPSQYSYILNCSEPIILRPSTNNLAFLMTPCYIVDDQDINIRNIYDYNNKLPNNYLSARNKIGNLKQEYKRNNKDYIFDDNYIYDMDNISDKKKKNNYKKICFPINNKEIFNPNNKNKLFNKIVNKVRNIDNKRAISTDRLKSVKDKKRTISTDRLNCVKDRYNFIYKDEFGEGENIYMNNKKNDLFLEEENFANNSKKNLIHKNKNKSCILSDINSGLTNRGNTKNNYDKINREIFSHLYNNNYLNNLKKIDNDKAEKYKSNNKKRNIFGINTERRKNQNYSIFDKKGEQNSNNFINNSHDYILNKSINNNRKTPYNKISKKDILSSSNFSVIDSTDKNKNIAFKKGIKKINKTPSINNFSNILNSQSNNQNLNRTSTTFSIGPGNKDNLKIMKNKKKEKIKNSINYQYESGPKNEFLEDNQDKNTTISNRISLQSISDLKMMELAGYYAYEDSSSENYQMNNIIHNKKKFKKSN